VHCTAEQNRGELSRIVMGRVQDEISPNHCGLPTDARAKIAPVSHPFRTAWDQSQAADLLKPYA
jgi:hypothetical protein